MKYDVYAVAPDGSAIGQLGVRFVFDPRTRVGTMFQGEATTYINFDHFTQISVSPSAEQDE